MAFLVALGAHPVTRHSLEKRRRCTRPAPRTAHSIVLASTSDFPLLPRPETPPLATDDTQKNAPSTSPLLSAVTEEASRIRVNLFCPGHKQGRFTTPDLQSVVGPNALSHDLPELPALDNLFAPEAAIRNAQNLATEAFIGVKDASSSKWSTFFLVNGSTCGIEAAILATARPGRRVALPRNAHQSAVHALVLSGVEPVWIDPVCDHERGLLHGVRVEDVATVVAANASLLDAVLVVSPTYHGACSDIASIAAITRAAGIPLIVDEAHGAHFAFHDALPRSAASCGADVVVQSTHKTLGAMTQAAMMHVLSSERVSRDRVAASLQLVQSSSPNYLLLSSLDAARDVMVRDGRAALERTIALAQDAASRIDALPGYAVLCKKGMPVASTDGCFELDPTRLTVLLPPTVSGYDLDDQLIARFGVYAELPAFRHITFIFTPGNSQEDVTNLLTSLSLYDATSEVVNKPPRAEIARVPIYDARPNTASMSPRDAFFAESEVVEASSAVDRISADTLCPYPPGIPVVVPGEVITKDCINLLRAVLDAGGSVSGAADESLQTLRVLIGSSSKP